MAEEKKARILLVQEDPIILGLVSGSLRPEGHEIVVATDPLEALKLTSQEFQQIDLVITRIDIKPISGLEFAKRLVRRGVDVPILFMSASRSMAAVISQSLGQSAVIGEPFTATDLRNAVRKSLAQRRKSEKARGVVRPVEG